MIRLTQEFGAKAGRQLTFDQDRVRVGRAPDNDVSFDPNVDLDSSAHHCEIVREDIGHAVVDSGSRNGTFVNGARVQRQRLHTGDVIECGRGGPRLRVEVPNAAVSAGHAAMPGTAPMPTYGAPQGGMPRAPVPPAAAATAGGFAPMPGAAPSAGFAPVAPSYPYGAPPMPQYGAPPQAPMGPPGSIGAAVAAKIPPGAQIGKRTVAMMIDAALAQSNNRRTSTGMKLAIAGLVVLMVAGLVAGGYFLWLEKEDTDERLASLGGDGAAGERITQQYESAIFMLARSRPGLSPQGFCTSFAVTQDLLATNAHCVDVAQQMVQEGAQILALQNNGRGNQIVVQPVFRDPRFHNAAMGLEGSGFDVGIMRASQPLATTVRLASVDDAMVVRPGARIYVYGFPGMTMNEVSPVATITEGVLNRATDFFDRAAEPAQAQKVQHTAQTTSGSSGSPIFLANGTVVAINAGSLADEEHQTVLDPTTGQRRAVEVNRSSNFKYGMRADLIRAAIQSVGESAP